MSDRYLCKAKRTDNGEWIMGYIVTSYSLTYIILPLSDGNFKWYNVDPSTCCQCTGLTDKKGNKIWEGDILSLSARLDDSYLDDVTYVEIKWNGFSWCTRESTEDDVMTEYDCNTFEVCGNIFDNPELLKGGTE